MFILRRHLRSVLFCAAICSIISNGQAYGQFTTVLNIPPDPDIGNSHFIGSNTQINLSVGGAIGDSFYLGPNLATDSNLELNMSGGSIGDLFEANSGAVVNISGGSVGFHFVAVGGGEVNISGGSVGTAFKAWGSNVNISGGTVGDHFEAGKVVNISGGTVGSVTSFAGSIVNISGGTVGDNYNALNRSIVNISGGTVGNHFNAGAAFDISYDAVVNISGGTVGDFFFVLRDNTVNISGGTVGDVFGADGGSEVNLTGVQFVLDGLDITSSLSVNVPFTINDRDVTLEGVLADGSPFSFDLNSSKTGSEDYFDPTALLTVNLAPVPEPTSLLLVATAIVALSVRSNRVWRTVAG